MVLWEDLIVTDVVKGKSKEAFIAHFGCEPEYLSYAPGRVNLIGEHTDYNDGFVLPCAIKFGTAMTAKKNGTNKMRLLAVDINNDTDEFECSATYTAHPTKTWANYLRAMVALIMQKGHKVEGLDVAISGDIPLGSGLSSSASLEVTFGNLVSQVFGLNIPLHIADDPVMADKPAHGFPVLLLQRFKQAGISVDYPLSHLEDVLAKILHLLHK